MPTTPIASLPSEHLLLPRHCDDRCVRRTWCRRPGTSKHHTVPCARHASENLVPLLGANATTGRLLWHYLMASLGKEGEKETERENKHKTHSVNSQVTVSHAAALLEKQPGLEGVWVLDLKTGI